MTMRTRKLIGTILMLIMLFIYAILVMAFAPAVLDPDRPLIQLVFYLVAGLGWTLPAGLLIKWMAKPDRP